MTADRDELLKWADQLDDLNSLYNNGLTTAKRIAMQLRELALRSRSEQNAVAQGGHVSWGPERQAPDGTIYRNGVASSAAPSPNAAQAAPEAERSGISHLDVPCVAHLVIACPRCYPSAAPEAAAAQARIAAYERATAAAPGLDETPRTDAFRKTLTEQLGDSPKSALNRALEGCEDLERDLTRARADLSALQLRKNAADRTAGNALKELAQARADLAESQASLRKSDEGLAAQVAKCCDYVERMDRAEARANDILALKEQVHKQLAASQADLAAAMGAVRDAEKQHYPMGNASGTFDVWSNLDAWLEKHAVIIAKAREGGC